MKKGIFKKVCFIINIMVLVICSNILLALGAIGTSTINADKDKVELGEQVTVHVEIKASEKLYYCEFLLNYDDSKLKFISTDGNADTDKPAGIIPYRYGESVLTDRVSFDIVFEAVEEGKSVIDISDYAIIEKSGERPSRVEMTLNGLTIQTCEAGTEKVTGKESETEVEKEITSDKESTTAETETEITENNDDRDQSTKASEEKNENVDEGEKDNVLWMMTGVIFVVIIIIGIFLVKKRK